MPCAHYPQMKYILTLQETIAVLAADGYARATQKPALVQLHSSPGIGNGDRRLVPGQARPLAAGRDRRRRRHQVPAMDAQMAGDLVGMMRPVTKWATVVQHPVVAAAHSAPGDQDRRDTPDGPGLRVPAGGHPRRAGGGAGAPDLAAVHPRAFRRRS